MDKVFGTIASGHYSIKRGFSQEVRELVEKLVPLTRLLWMSTKVNLNFKKNVKYLKLISII